jgi:hypothetical protein
MRRFVFLAVALTGVFSTENGAQAVFFDDGAHYCKRTYHENARWPWPYQTPDRVAVREPFCMMVNNGWRRQNLLGAHHFNPENNQLTTAGELRVQWILTQTPPDRRSIFIERSLNVDTTAGRLASVRDYATKVAVDGRVPQIEETFLASEGRPAAVVDATNVKFMQAMPAPVLPEASANTVSTGN